MKDCHGVDANFCVHAVLLWASCVLVMCMLAECEGQTSVKPHSLAACVLRDVCFDMLYMFDVHREAHSKSKRQSSGKGDEEKHHKLEVRLTVRNALVGQNAESITSY